MTPIGMIIVLLPEEAVREEDLPTQHPATGASPWFPPSHVHPRRAAHPARSSAAGSCPAISLIQPIRERSTFVSLSRLGSRARRNGLTAVFLGVDGIGGTHGWRAAYAIPRAAGNAVTRNRIRRRLRAVLHELATSDRLAQGDWLFIVRPQPDTVSLADMDYLSLKSLVRAVVDKAAGVRTP
jgi:ribonuclease P protein component